MPFKYEENLKQLSRELRHNMTKAEKVLWYKIRNKQIGDFQFYRQKPIGKYIVDFFCPKAELVIEIDGGQHYENQNIEKDRLRDQFLQKTGLRIIRFTNLDILRNIDNVVEKIYREI